MITGLLISDSTFSKFIIMTRTHRTKKKTSKTSNTENCRRYRQRLAERNPHLLELMKKKAREKARERRRAPKTEEQLKHLRELQRIRQRRYW